VTLLVCSLSFAVFAETMPVKTVTVSGSAVMQAEPGAFNHANSAKSRKSQ
jgi:hypothetical protein